MSCVFCSNIQWCTAVHSVCSINCLWDKKYTCALGLYHRSQTFVLFVLLMFYNIRYMFQHNQEVNLETRYVAQMRLDILILPLLYE